MDELIRQIRWTGTTCGLVKTLPLFNKKFHTVPDAATPATTAFLAKLYAPELAAEAESFFQKTREALHYKRTDISLSTSGANAILQTPDFTLEWDCALNTATPEEWVRTCVLHSVARRALLDTPGFDGLFDGAFSKLEFLLTTPVQIEAVIDAVEALDGKSDPAFSVDYPSNYAQCTVRVGGVVESVVFTGGSLYMEFPRPGSPRELADEFARVRHAFDLANAAGLSDMK
jgi:hypothetical protein